MSRSARVAEKLSQRDQMLLLLENDVDAQGWDQPDKFWGVKKADDGEEYLEFIATFEGSAVEALQYGAARGNLKDEFDGIVVSIEAWSYPPHLVEILRTPREITAFRRLTPPEDHPDRIEKRIVNYMDRTGTFKSVERVRGHQPTISDGTDIELRHAMTLILGLDPEFNNKRNMVHALFEVGEIFQRLTEQAEREGWDQTQLLRAIFAEAPQDVRAIYRDLLPEEARKELGLE